MKSVGIPSFFFFKSETCSVSLEPTEKNDGDSIEANTEPKVRRLHSTSTLRDCKVVQTFSE